jgi:hypothetical protein
MCSGHLLENSVSVNGAWHSHVTGCSLLVKEQKSMPHFRLLEREPRAHLENEHGRR